MIDTLGLPGLIFAVTYAKSRPVLSAALMNRLADIELGEHLRTTTVQE